MGYNVPVAKLYPINLKVSGLTVLVVGGGSVAVRKTKRLLGAGARVRLVAPRLSPALANLGRRAPKGSLVAFKRRFRPADVRGMGLVFACTDDPQVNSRIVALSRTAGVLAQSATRPAESDFTLPSVIERGELLITISTGGASPALSKHLRERLEEVFPRGFGDYLEILSRVRSRLLAKGRPSAENSPKFRALVRGKLEGAVVKKNWRGTDRILTKTLGPDFSLAALGWKKRSK